MIPNQNDFSAFLTDAVQTRALDCFYINYYHPIDEELWQRLQHKFFESSVNYFYCTRPELSFTVFAFDELTSISDQNFNKYDDINKVFNRMKREIVSNAGHFNLIQNPFVFGMLKFPSEVKEKIWTSFSDSKWFVPKFMLLKEGTKRFLVINAIYYKHIENYLHRAIETLMDENVSSSSNKNISYNILEPNINDWSAKINYALKNIHDGTIGKIVLARYTDIELSAQPSVHALTSSLEAQYPGCYTFACKSDKSIFFGSTPEKLFSLRNNILQTEALAGSIPRGDSVSTDLSLQDHLLHDKKNLEEHNAVINFLKEQLASLSEEVRIEKEPVIKKLSNIQHLYTPIEAKIKNGTSLFSILEKIYPTPAVCGIPPQVSKRLIQEIENFERGLYAGALGWAGLNDTAEMFVGIRSAIVNEKNVRAFAGGGIVEGSNSTDEFNETILKLKPILSLFSNENISKS